MNDSLREKLQRTIKEAKSIVIGQEPLIKAILCALANEGHLLIEGVPGIGKTLAITTLAKLCDLSCKRVQFTADLLPSDLIGSMIFSPKSEDFKAKFGPIFTQLLLGDEINRAPPKVQSALLEAMEEGQVTLGEKTYKLTRPFVVLATQNPIEQEGTYPLPEAQVDRFMMKVNVTYPQVADEKKILDFDRRLLESLRPLFSTDEIIKLRQDVESVYVDDKIKDMIVRMVDATRPESKSFLKELRGGIKHGASPRASIWLYKCSRYMAYLEGKEFVSPEQLMAVTSDVLGHRILLSYEALMDGLDGRKVAQKIAQSLF